MASDGTIPTTQKAWMVAKRGKPRDALAFQTDVPVPKPKRGEVLIKVRAVALNPIGWKMMCVLPNWLSQRPHPAEHDLAGVVVDANGTAFANGDDVIGYVELSLQLSSPRGALAEYVVLPEDYVTPKPANLTWEEAAALPLAGLTALQALRLGGYDPAPPAPAAAASSAGDAIFVNGGSTSVGIYAIQLANALGLHVTASASSRNAAFVRALGADEFIDYTTGPLGARMAADPPESRFGMVLDAAGSLDTGLYVRSGAYVRRGGAYVTTGPWPDEKGWTGLVRRWTGPLLRPSFLGGVPTPWRLVHVVNKREDMRTLCTLIERGMLRPYVDSMYEFGSALDAYDRLMTSRATGKVIIKVDGGA